jgi:DNA-binding GntR family transcriptional regulator
MDLKVSAQSVQGQAVRKLREAIVSGVFQPGERLIESELCDRLGISRPSVREALRSLEAERLVTIVPNKGPMIPILTIEEAREIYNVRALLEGEAAALFAERASVSATTHMRRSLEMFDASVKASDLAGQLAATRQFYEQMLMGCGNRIIHEMLDALVARITFLRSKSMSLPGRAQKSSRELRAILKAILAQDAEAARAAAVAHVLRASEAATKVYSAEAKGNRPSAA